MTLLNCLLTEKPTVGEESHCEHIQSDGESLHLNSQAGTWCRICSLSKSPDLWLIFSEIVSGVMSRFDSSHVSTQLWTSHQWATLLCVTLANYHVQLSQNHTKCCTVTFLERPTSFKGAYTWSTASAALSLISLGAAHQHFPHPPPEPDPVSLLLQHFHFI